MPQHGICRYYDKQPMPRRLQKLAPVHPGEILLEEFWPQSNRLAKDTSVPPRRIHEIIRGTRAVSADIALRLGRYFGTTERFWLNLQAHYDLEVEKERLGDRLKREVVVRKNAQEP
jgi:addiction module HigA family antidote